MSHKGNDYLVDNLMDREVKRPEKKEYTSDTWNSCCDKWEAYLPSEKELQELIGCKGSILSKSIAKAIHKRIRG